MPITIKEILSSDSMSGLVEKINFNFDQLILAGGGPPGPIGPIGPAGVPGVRGLRGDNWFVGPSAFGQTTNHGGTGSLQIEDHYLDINGNVFSYFDIGGITGWTFSGVNLKGPTGSSGTTGSSNEWQLYSGITANSISSPGWFVNPTINPAGTTYPDYMSTKKGRDLLFLGDINWNYDKLISYGRPVAGDNNGLFSPKIGVIQNQLSNSKYGINGLAFGAYGVSGGIPGTSVGQYPGGSSIINDQTSNTHAKNFAYLGLYQDDLVWFNSGLTGFFTKFGIRTANNPIKIESGGWKNDDWYTPQPLELSGNIVRITGYEYDTTTPVIDNLVSRQIIINSESSISMLGGTFNGYSREININSANYFNGNPNSAVNKYGYISFQNSNLGLSVPGSFPIGKEHHFGTVIIGPTYNGDLSTNSAKPLGIDGYQGLAIVRKITANNTGNSDGKLYNPSNQLVADTSLAFLYTDYKNSTDISTKSARIGHVTGFRTLADSSISAVIDNLIIQSGDKSTASSTTSRIGVQNGSDLRRPHMPFHVQMEFPSGDPGIRSNAYDGGYTYESGTLLQGWIAGFDNWNGQRRANGVGIGYKSWLDGITGPGSTYSNPIINTYFRTDNNQTQPNDGFGATFNGYGLGINNPHLYIQTGGETSNGNLGIGIYPENGTTSGLTSSRMIAPYSKLSVAGSMTLAGQSSGYHQFLSIRPQNGILVEGSYVHGATTISKAYSTFVYGGTGLYNLMGSNVNTKIAMSLDGISMAKKFISKGNLDLYSYTADFALADTKTGMMSFPDDPAPGDGYLVANPDLLSYASSTGPSIFTRPGKVAKFTHRGEAGYTANLDYPSFTVENAFAQRPNTVTTNDLVQYLWKFRDNSTTTYNLLSVFEIPVEFSTIILDLSGTRNYLRYFDSSSSMTSTEYVDQWYLDGTATTYDAPIDPSVYGFQGFTLQDGHYDGQILDLIILNCDPKNQGVLLPSIPKGVPTNTGTIVNTSSINNINDNICMQAEPIDVRATTYPYDKALLPYAFGWPMAQGSSLQYQDRSTPYPFPYAAINPNTTFNTTNSGGGTAWNANKNSWFRNRFSLWSDSSTANNTVIAPVYTSSPSGVGFGAFRISSFKSIKFVWKFDTTTTTNGCWYEISRTNLVNRQTRSWVPGSGLGASIPEILSPPISA